MQAGNAAGQRVHRSNHIAVSKASYLGATANIRDLVSIGDGPANCFRLHDVHKRPFNHTRRCLHHSRSYRQSPGVLSTKFQFAHQEYSLFCYRCSSWHGEAAASSFRHALGQTFAQGYSAGGSKKASLGSNITFISFTWEYTYLKNYKLHQFVALLPVYTQASAQILNVIQ